MNECITGSSLIYVLDFIKDGLPIVKKYNAKMVLVYNTQSMQTCMLCKITLQSEMFFL
jgi:hypothetical protein